MPETVGTMRQLYWAERLLRPRTDGPWDLVPGIGLTEVESTEVDSVPGFTAYFPETEADVNDGRWEHSGWIAMIEIADELDQSLLP